MSIKIWKLVILKLHLIKMTVQISLFKQILLIQILGLIILIASKTILDSKIQFGKH